MKGIDFNNRRAIPVSPAGKQQKPTCENCFGTLKQSHEKQQGGSSTQVGEEIQREGRIPTQLTTQLDKQPGETEIQAVPWWVTNPQFPRSHKQLIGIWLKGPPFHGNPQK